MLMSSPEQKTEYTPCLRKTDLLRLYFYANFGKCGPTFTDFSVLNSERNFGGS